MEHEDKEYVLAIHPSARCTHKAFCTVIVVGVLEIGSGFSAASAWLDAKQQILRKKDKESENRTV